MLQIYGLPCTLRRLHLPAVSSALDWICRVVFGAYVPYTGEIGAGTRFGYLSLEIAIHDGAVFRRNDMIFFQDVAKGGRK